MWKYASAGEESKTTDAMARTIFMSNDMGSTGIPIKSQNYVGKPMSQASVSATAQQEFSDADWAVVDNGDQSKKLKFQISGLTTATARTATWPNKSGTVAMTSDIPSAGGITLLGSFPMAGSSPFSVTGLTLTNYKSLRIVLGAISTTNSTFQFAFNSVLLAPSASAASDTLSGFIDVDLTTGLFLSHCKLNTAASTVAPLSYMSASGLTNASTTVSITVSGGTGDAGTFYVYGLN